MALVPTYYLMLTSTVLCGGSRNGEIITDEDTVVTKVGFTDTRDIVDVHEAEVQFASDCLGQLMCINGAHDVHTLVVRHTD